MLRELMGERTCPLDVQSRPRDRLAKQGCHHSVTHELLREVSATGTGGRDPDHRDEDTSYMPRGAGFGVEVGRPSDAIALRCDGSRSCAEELLDDAGSSPDEPGARSRSLREFLDHSRRGLRQGSG